MNNTFTEMEHPVIIFDGHCHFCIAIIGFILKRDKEYIFRVNPVQEPESRKLLRERGITFASLYTVYLVSEKVRSKSAAVFEILKKMPFPWKLFVVFKILPSFLTDAVYSFVSKNRFIFGRSETKLDELKSQFGDRFLTKDAPK